MNHQVLIVDQAHNPIEIVEWSVAMCKLIRDNFRVLNYSEKTVKSAYKTWILPDIIIAPKIIKIRPAVRFKYDAVNLRDGNVCAYCGNKFHPNEMTVDHILPVVRGGTNSWRNCISACKKCNNRKSDKTPEEAGMFLKYLPCEPKDSLDYSLYKMDIKDDWIPFLSKKAVVNLNHKHKRVSNAQ